MLQSELMKHYTGVGLSAIQLGIPVRMCIIKIIDNFTLRKTDSQFLTLWNPTIISKSNMQVANESCLSIPDATIPICRCMHIEVLNGDDQIFYFSNFNARIVQHEIDHMDGVLIIDHEPGDFFI